MKTISVIVPTHNTENYIRECLDSILEQTYPELEILCIDSSTDGTTAIVKDISEKDPRIRHIIDPNSSYGYKLNRGIREAKGEYIGIVDSDDYIEKDMYKRLVAIVEDSCADFVKADHSCFYTEKGENAVYRYDRTIANPDWYGKPVSCRDIPEMLYRTAISIWSGLYRTDFLRDNNITAHESAGASYQDTGFSTLTYLHAKKIYHINESFYRYRTDNVNSSVKSNKKMNLIIGEWRWIDKEVKKRNITSEEILRALVVKKLDAYFWNFDRLDVRTGIQFAQVIRGELDSIALDTDFLKVLPEDKRRFFDMLYYSGQERKDEVEVSVIIPVYNTERYLPECLDSVILQNGVQIEIICVNDGSTDGSQSILKQYRDKDNRIIIINLEENAGQACARNTGLDVAKGKYIMFLDSDDMLCPYALLDLLVLAEHNKSEITCFDAECLYETERLNTIDNKDFYYQRAHSFGLLDGKNMIAELIEETGNFCDSACLMFIRRQWLDDNHIRFIPGILYEDSPFSIECMLKADRVFHTNRRFYVYRVRYNSTMTTQYTVKNLYGRLIGYDYIKRVFCEETLSARQRKSFLRYMDAVKWSGFNIANTLNGYERNRIFDYPLAWHLILELMDFGYMRNDIESGVYKQLFAEAFTQKKRIILYGAGQQTRILLLYIDIKGIMTADLCVVVSKRADNPETICNRPVYALDEGFSISEEDMIVVPSAGESREKVMAQLKKDGASDVVCMNNEMNAYIKNIVKQYYLYNQELDNDNRI